MAFSCRLRIVLLVLIATVVFNGTDGKTSYRGRRTQHTCVVKHTDADSFVCVCNATYCDTLERPSKMMAPGKILVYTTSKDEHRFHKEILDVHTSTSGRRRPGSNPIPQLHIDGCPSELKSRNNHITLCIDTKQLKQEITGFGGSFTDSAGINIKNLSSEAQKKLMESYFSENGLEYNFGRVPIGGSDFSTRPYSYDDDSIGDMELNDFALQMEDYEYKIPIIKAAQKLSATEIKLVATTWSPPAWMKINGKLNGFGWLKPPVGGPYYKTYAQYHIKFFDEYKKNGITFWGMTPVNEPLSGFIPNYIFNCLAFSPSMLRTFVNQNLGPTLRSSSYNATQILIYDLERIGLECYVNEIMSDPMAETYVDGIALHWYSDPLANPSCLDRVHSKYANKHLMMTEASITGLFSAGEPVVLGSWERGDIYAYYIIQNLQHWVTGWIDWNLALNSEGGPNWAKNNVDAPIIVNGGSDEFYKQPMYYTFGHFSKFVPVGSHVVDIRQGTVKSAAISTVAFLRPDNGVVLVILNRKSAPVQLDITDPLFGTFSANISGNAIQTYIWWH